MDKQLYTAKVEIQFTDSDGVGVTVGVEVSERFSEQTPSDEIVTALLSKARDTAYNVLERRLRLARGHF